MISSTKSTYALSGVRVLDLTRVLAGPFCTRLMADMGAEVIKVEPPGGDVARHFEYVTPELVSGYFMQQNCGKKGISIDLAEPGGKNTLANLIQISDVIVENYRPGVMKRLGFSYEDVTKINPSIVMCSISAFGQNSPYADRPAGDMVVQSMSGIASLTGDPGGPPQTTGMSLGDTTGGIHAFGAICAALYQRSITGLGEYIDISLVDCILWQNEWASQYMFLGGNQISPTRYGNRRPILIPGNLFKGKDGWIAIVASTDPGWTNLSKAMGLPELATDPRFKNRIERMKHRDKLEQIVEEWVKSFDSVKDVEHFLADQGSVQCGAVRTWKEMLEDSHVKQRNLVVQVQDPILGETPVMNSPIRFHRLSAGVTRPAPIFGQHTEEVLRDILGYSDDQIMDLINTNTLHADDQVLMSIVEQLVT